jgi:hypothetical protein
MTVPGSNPSGAARSHLIMQAVGAAAGLGMIVILWCPLASAAASSPPCRLLPRQIATEVLGGPVKIQNVGSTLCAVTRTPATISSPRVSITLFRNSTVVKRFEKNLRDKSNGSVAGVLVLWSLPPTHPGDQQPGIMWAAKNGWLIMVDVKGTNKLHMRVTQTMTSALARI